MSNTFKLLLTVFLTLTINVQLVEPDSDSFGSQIQNGGIKENGHRKVSYSRNAGDTPLSFSKSRNTPIIDKQRQLERQRQLEKRLNFLTREYKHQKQVDNKNHTWAIVIENKSVLPDLRSAIHFERGLKMQGFTSASIKDFTEFNRNIITSKRYQLGSIYIIYKVWYKTTRFPGIFIEDSHTIFTFAERYHHPPLHGNAYDSTSTPVSPDGHAMLVSMAKGGWSGGNQRVISMSRHKYPSLSSSMWEFYIESRHYSVIMKNIFQPSVVNIIIVCYPDIQLSRIQTSSQSTWFSGIILQRRAPNFQYIKQHEVLPHKAEQSIFIWKHDIQETVYTMYVTSHSLNVITYSALYMSEDAILRSEARYSTPHLPNFASVALVKVPPISQLSVAIEKGTPAIKLIVAKFSTMEDIIKKETLLKSFDRKQNTVILIQKPICNKNIEIPNYKVSDLKSRSSPKHSSFAHVFDYLACKFGKSQSCKPLFKISLYTDFPVKYSLSSYGVNRRIGKRPRSVGIWNPTQFNQISLLIVSRPEFGPVFISNIRSHQMIAIQILKPIPAIKDFLERKVRLDVYKETAMLEPPKVLGNIHEIPLMSPSLIKISSVRVTRAHIPCYKSYDGHQHYTLTAESYTLAKRPHTLKPRIQVIRRNQMSLHINRTSNEGKLQETMIVSHPLRISSVVAVPHLVCDQSNSCFSHSEKPTTEASGRKEIKNSADKSGERRKEDKTRSNKRHPNKACVNGKPVKNHRCTIYAGSSRLTKLKVGKRLESKLRRVRLKMVDIQLSLNILHTEIHLDVVQREDPITTAVVNPSHRFIQSVSLKNPKPLAAKNPEQIRYANLDISTVRMFSTLPHLVKPYNFMIPRLLALPNKHHAQRIMAFYRSFKSSLQENVEMNAWKTHRTPSTIPRYGSKVKDGHRCKIFFSKVNLEDIQSPQEQMYLNSTVSALALARKSRISKQASGRSATSKRFSVTTSHHDEYRYYKKHFTTFTTEISSGNTIKYTPDDHINWYRKITCFLKNLNKLLYYGNDYGNSNQQSKQDSGCKIGACSTCIPHLETYLKQPNFSLSNVKVVNYCPKPNIGAFWKRSMDSHSCIHGVIGPYYWIMPFTNYFIIWGADKVFDFRPFITYYNIRYRTNIYPTAIDTFILQRNLRLNFGMMKPYSNLSPNYLNFPITFCMCSTSLNLNIRLNQLQPISYTHDYITQHYVSFTVSTTPVLRTISTFKERGDPAIDVSNTRYFGLKPMPPMIQLFFNLNIFRFESTYQTDIKLPVTLHFTTHTLLLFTSTNTTILQTELPTIKTKRFITAGHTNKRFTSSLQITTFVFSGDHIIRPNFIKSKTMSSRRSTSKYSITTQLTPIFISTSNLKSTYYRVLSRIYSVVVYQLTSQQTKVAERMEIRPFPTADMVAPRHTLYRFGTKTVSTPRSLNYMRYQNTNLRVKISHSMQPYSMPDVIKFLFQKSRFYILTRDTTSVRKLWTKLGYMTVNIDNTVATMSTYLSPLPIFMKLTYTTTNPSEMYLSVFRFRTLTSNYSKYQELPKKQLNKWTYKISYYLKTLQPSLNMNYRFLLFTFERSKIAARDRRRVGISVLKDDSHVVAEFTAPYVDIRLIASYDITEGHSYTDTYFHTVTSTSKASVRALSKRKDRQSHYQLLILQGLYSLRETSYQKMLIVLTRKISTLLTVYTKKGNRMSLMMITRGNREIVQISYDVVRSRVFSEARHTKVKFGESHHTGLLLDHHKRTRDVTQHESVSTKQPELENIHKLVVLWTEFVVASKVNRNHYMTKVFKDIAIISHDQRTHSSQLSVVLTHIFKSSFEIEEGHSIFYEVKTRRNDRLYGISHETRDKIRHHIHYMLVRGRRTILIVNKDIVRIFSIIKQQATRYRTYKKYLNSALLVERVQARDSVVYDVTVAQLVIRVEKIDKHVFSYHVDRTKVFEIDQGEKILRVASKSGRSLLKFHPHKRFVLKSFKSLQFLVIDNFRMKDLTKRRDLRSEVRHVYYVTAKSSVLQVVWNFVQTVSEIEDGPMITISTSTTSQILGLYRTAAGGAQQLAMIGYIKKQREVATLRKTTKPSLIFLVLQYDTVKHLEVDVYRMLINIHTQYFESAVLHTRQDWKITSFHKLEPKHTLVLDHSHAPNTKLVETDRHRYNISILLTSKMSKPKRDTISAVLVNVFLRFVATPRRLKKLEESSRFLESSSFGNTYNVDKLKSQIIKYKAKNFKSEYEVTTIHFHMFQSTTTPDVMRSYGHGYGLETWKIRLSYIINKRLPAVLSHPISNKVPIWSVSDNHETIYFRPKRCEFIAMLKRSYEESESLVTLVSVHRLTVGTSLEEKHVMSFFSSNNYNGIITPLTVRPINSTPLITASSLAEKKAKLQFEAVKESRAYSYPYISSKGSFIYKVIFSTAIDVHYVAVSSKVVKEKDKVFQQESEDEGDRSLELYHTTKVPVIYNKSSSRRFFTKEPMIYYNLMSMGLQSCNRKRVSKTEKSSVGTTHKKDHKCTRDKDPKSKKDKDPNSKMDKGPKSKKDKDPKSQKGTDPKCTKDKDPRSKKVPGVATKKRKTREDGEIEACYPNPKGSTLPGFVLDKYGSCKSRVPFKNILGATLTWKNLETSYETARPSEVRLLPSFKTTKNPQTILLVQKVVPPIVYRNDHLHHDHVIIYLSMSKKLRRITRFAEFHLGDNTDLKVIPIIKDKSISAVKYLSSLSIQTQLVPTKSSGKQNREIVFQSEIEVTEERYIEIGITTSTENAVMIFHRKRNIDTMSQVGVTLKPNIPIVIKRFTRNIKISKFVMDGKVKYAPVVKYVASVDRQISLVEERVEVDKRKFPEVAPSSKIISAVKIHWFRTFKHHHGVLESYFSITEMKMSKLWSKKKYVKYVIDWLFTDNEAYWTCVTFRKTSGLKTKTFITFRVKHVHYMSTKQNFIKVKHIKLKLSSSKQAKHKFKQQPLLKQIRLLQIGRIKQYKAALADKKGKNVIVTKLAVRIKKGKSTSIMVTIGKMNMVQTKHDKFMKSVELLAAFVKNASGKKRVVKQHITKTKHIFLKHTIKTWIKGRLARAKIFGMVRMHRWMYKVERAANLRFRKQVGIKSLKTVLSKIMKIDGSISNKKGKPQTHSTGVHLRVKYLPLSWRSRSATKPFLASHSATSGKDGTSGGPFTTIIFRIRASSKIEYVSSRISFVKKEVSTLYIRSSSLMVARQTTSSKGPKVPGGLDYTPVLAHVPSPVQKLISHSVSSYVDFSVMMCRVNFDKQSVKYAYRSPKLSNKLRGMHGWSAESGQPELETEVTFEWVTDGFGNMQKVDVSKLCSRTGKPFLLKNDPQQRPFTLYKAAKITTFNPSAIIRTCEGPTYITRSYGNIYLAQLLTVPKLTKVTIIRQSTRSSVRATRSTPEIDGNSGDVFKLSSVASTIFYTSTVTNNVLKPSEEDSFVSESVQYDGRGLMLLSYTKPTPKSNKIDKKS